MVPAFPYLAVALGGLGLWLSGRTKVLHYTTTSRGGSTNESVVAQDFSPAIAMSRADLAACLALAVLAAGLGAVVFAQRLDVSPDGIALYGEYDTADLSYYAAEASEASHTIPPMASYYSGHKLNAAYYPHLVFAMVHRFANVPVLSIYFAYAWPTFLVLSALTGFVLVRSLASRAVAVLAVALVLAGSDFSYLVAWYLPDAQNSGAWDYILWPTNFLSPTMQILHFNTWGLSLPLFFTVLYAIVRSLQTRSRGWIVLSAFLLAMLFEFRPFAYVVLMAALGAAAVFSGRDAVARWHFVATAVLGVVFSTPFLYAALTHRAGGPPDPPGDRVLSAGEADAHQDRAHRRLRQLHSFGRPLGGRFAPPCSCCWPRSLSLRSVSASGWSGRPVSGVPSAAGPRQLPP